MYSLLRKALFKLDAEKSHDMTLNALAFTSKKPQALARLKARYADKVSALPVRCMGLKFRHPIGLAAGLDKDARALPAFSALGFSGVELGTVTPQAQPGNEKPRIFRLSEDMAIINRMGFNSSGMDAFLNNLDNSQHNSIVGINVGKNATTAIENAHMDYTSAIQRAYNHADYITVNISSPNTKSLRELQNEEYLDGLLLNIKKTQAKCEKVHKKHIPFALKVAPDLTDDEIEIIAELLLTHDFDGLIATNTTISRPDTLTSEYAEEQGGLSGEPIKDLSTDCIRRFYQILKGKIPIIGVGGISNADDAWEKLLAGADYLQIYSLLIYQGPEMIAEIVTGLQKKLKASGFEDIETAMIALRES